MPIPSRIPLLVLLLSSLAVEVQAFSAKNPPAAPLVSADSPLSALPGELPETSVALSEVQRANKSGFELESAETREHLMLQAKSFARISKGQASDADVARFAKFCATNPGSPFCAFAADPDFGELNIHRLPHKFHTSLARKFISSVVAAIKRGDTDFLRTVPDPALREGFKRITSYSTVETLANRVIASTDACRAPQIAVALGTKAEEFFPEVGMRKKAVQLYEKVASCGETDASARASYRGALLNIWDDNCKAALPALDRLIAKSAASPVMSYQDYRSRVLFWKNRCETGSEGEGAPARLELLQKFPFTVHNLLVNQPDLEQIKQLAPSKSDTMIRLRSSKSPVANQKILAVETLQAADEDGVARKALSDLVAESDALEPEVRLYIAVLLGRAEDHIPKFRLLGALFREKPSLISRSTLELFYPFREFKQHLPARTLVNDILLLSLIRQESAFNLKARSPAGAMGLMQLMPRTARKFGHFRTKWDLFQPEANVRIGARFFSYLIERYSGDVELALAAYNAGPSRVDEWQRRYPVSSRMLFLDLIPFKETREYVASIARNYYWYTALYSESAALGQAGVKDELYNKDLSKVFRVFSLSQ